MPEQHNKPLQPIAREGAGSGLTAALGYKGMKKALVIFCLPALTVLISGCSDSARRCNPESSTPTNAAQLTALNDAKSRRSVICSTASAQCRFLVSEEPDGSIEVRLDLDPCGGVDHGSEALIYSRDGELIRIDEIFS